MADYEDDDEDDDEVEDIACGQEIIDWWSYAADGYRFTSDTADSETAEQERWVVAQCFQRGDEYAYEALSDYLTLAEAEEYLAAEGEDPELASLIARAESTQDYDERELLATEVGVLVRAQVERFVRGPQ